MAPRSVKNRIEAEIKAAREARARAAGAGQADPYNANADLYGVESGTDGSKLVNPSTSAAMPAATGPVEVAQQAEAVVAHEPSRVQAAARASTAASAVLCVAALVARVVRFSWLRSRQHQHQQQHDKQRQERWQPAPLPPLPTPQQQQEQQQLQQEWLQQQQRWLLQLQQRLQQQQERLEQQQQQQQGTTGRGASPQSNSKQAIARVAGDASAVAAGRAGAAVNALIDEPAVSGAVVARQRHGA